MRRRGTTPRSLLRTPKSIAPAGVGEKVLSDTRKGDAPAAESAREKKRRRLSLSFSLSFSVSISLAGGRKRRREGEKGAKVKSSPKQRLAADCSETFVFLGSPDP